MRLSLELVNVSSIDVGFPTNFRWRIAVKRHVDTMAVIVILNSSGLSSKSRAFQKMTWSRNSRRRVLIRRSTNVRASWNFRSIDGLMTTVTFKSRRGLRNSDHNPNRNLSRAVRLGVRRHARLIMRSFCFRGRYLVITALVPPGPRCLATVVSKCTSSKSRLFISGKGRGDSNSAQACSTNGLYAGTWESPPTDVK